MIVTVQPRDKEEEDFRDKKKKVGFGGADAYVKSRCDASDELIKSNHQQEQIREARHREHTEHLLSVQAKEYEARQYAEKKVAEEKAKQEEREKQEKQDEEAKKQQEEQKAQQEQTQQQAQPAQEQQMGRSM